MDEWDELESEEGLSLAPMLDMVFILVIFLMVSLQFGDPVEKFEVDLPEAIESSLGAGGKKDAILEIQKDGSLFYNQKRIEQGSNMWDDMIGSPSCQKGELLLLVDKETHFSFFSKVTQGLKMGGCEGISIGVKPETGSRGIGL